MKKLLTMPLMAAAVALTAATPGYLTVHQTNGVTPSHAVSDIRKVVFDTDESGTLSIYHRSSQTVTRYAYDAVERFTFDEEPSGIEEVFGPQSTLEIVYDAAGQRVDVVSACPVKSVVLYGVGGNVVSLQHPDSPEASMGLEGITPGLYIIKAVTSTETVTQKIVKR